MKNKIKLGVSVLATLALMATATPDAMAQRKRITNIGKAATQKVDTAKPAESTPAATDNDDARRQKLRDMLVTLTANDKIENAHLNAEKSPKYLLLPNGKAMMLQITKKSVNQNLSNIMPIDETNIYPGCIVYANSELMAGKPQEVDFGVKDQLGTVTVYVNFNNGGKESRTGVKAEGSSIRAAIASILSEAGTNTPPAAVQYSHNQYTSTQKIAIDMGCSVEYLDAKCDINTSTSVGSETMYDMQMFSQNFYTVTIEPEDKDKTNFFGKGVTAEVLERAAKNGPIAIIKSVTYGRNGFFKKEYKASDFSFQASESGSYKSVTVNSKQDITKNSTSTTSMGRVYGGSATTAGKALTSESFAEEMAKNMEVSSSNQGVPVTYTVQFIASGKQCIQKQTGEYEEVDYIPLTNRISLEINMAASVLKGTKSVRLNWQYDVIQIDKTGDDATIVATAKSDKIDWKNTNNVTTPIDLGANKYFCNNEIRLWTESCRAAGQKWVPCVDGKVNVPSDGKLKIKLDGSYYQHTVGIKDKDGNSILK